MTKINKLDNLKSQINSIDIEIDERLLDFDYPADQLLALRNKRLQLIEECSQQEMIGAAQKEWFTAKSNGYNAQWFFKIIFILLIICSCLLYFLDRLSIIDASIISQYLNKWWSQFVDFTR